MTKLVFDIDFIIFAAVSIAEEKFIAATHTPTGRKFEFDNKTSLWGHYKKKEGGWIAEENAKNGNTFYKPDDFEVVECQRPRPFKVKYVDKLTGESDPSKDYFISPWEGAKNVLNSKIENICEKLGTKEYFGYTSKGKTFREDIATILPYKGNRTGLRPLLLDKMKDYVCERHNITLVENIESDDAVNIATLEGYNNWVKNGKKDCDKVICVQEDKDGKQCSGWHYNPSKDDKPRLIEGLGSLWLDSKGKVDGCGRMWLLHQVLSSDDSDNYASNSASDIAWGEKSSYKLLKDCKTDREAFEAVVKGYKILYPKPVTVINFRGDTIVVDWLYAMNENFNLARMLRKVDEGTIDIAAVLKKLGIPLEDTQ
jgi:hypothetical protein